MNKFIMRLGTLVLIIGLLFGCSTDTNDLKEGNNSNSTEVAEEIVVITISKDEEEEIITEKEVSVEDGAILMDVLKENFSIEEEDGFITSIEGVAPEENEEKAWIYFVNGEAAMVGANEYELTSGDEVSFDLQSWE